MTPEEKAEEILEDYNTTQFHNDGTRDVYTGSAVLYMLHEMSEWKDKQFDENPKSGLVDIDKAVEWLKNNIHDYYMTNEFEEWFDEMFEDFKKTMKKE